MPFTVKTILSPFAAPNDNIDSILLALAFLPFFVIVISDLHFRAVVTNKLAGLA